MDLNIVRCFSKLGASAKLPLWPTQTDHLREKRKFMMLGDHSCYVPPNLTTVANNPISMSKITQTLRLFDQGRSKLQITEQTGISRNTLMTPRQSPNGVYLRKRGVIDKGSRR